MIYSIGLKRVLEIQYARLSHVEKSLLGVSSYHQRYRKLSLCAGVRSLGPNLFRTNLFRHLWSCRQGCCCHWMHDDLSCNAAPNEWEGLTEKFEQGVKLGHRLGG